MNKIFLIIASIVMSSSALADTLPRRDISVQGQATRMVVPDQADVRLTVEGRAKDVNTAMDLAGQRSQSIVDVLYEFVSKNSVRALHTQVREVVRGTTRSWRRDSGEPMEILASREIQLNGLAIERLGELMNALSEQPLARIDQVQAIVSNTAEIQDEILMLAIDDAKARAERVAKRLDVKLGLPISVNVHAIHAPRPHAEMRMMAMQADAAGGYDSVGENQIRASVSVRFELEAD